MVMITFTIFQRFNTKNKNIYYHGQKEYTEARSVKKIDMVTDPEIGNVIKNLIKDKDSCIDSDGNNTCIDLSLIHI